MKRILECLSRRGRGWLGVLVGLALVPPQVQAAEAELEAAPVDGAETVEAMTEEADSATNEATEMADSEEGEELDREEDTAGEDEEADEDAELEDEEGGDYRNWFDVSAGGALTSGSRAEFQRRYGIPGTAFGGVEEFHYERDVGEYSLFKIDGRGIFNNHDYALTLDYTDPDRGYLRGGYEEFRTWYNGAGGYFPGPAPVQWFDLYDDDFHVDRREAWFEGGLTLPDIPQITVRYSHREREGKQDSTIWGDTTTAVPSPHGPTRKIVPAFKDIDETRDSVNLDARHTFGETDAGVGFRFESLRIDTRRNLRHNPGEANDGYVTQRDGQDSTLFNAHAFTESRFSEKVWLTVGYAFTDLDNDLSGYRAYGSGYDPDIAQRLPNPNTFQDLSGNSRLSQHLANINLRLALGDHWSLVPAFRVESQNTDNFSGYGQPAAPLSPNQYSAESTRGLLDLSESLRLRFTGLTNWVLYAEGYWLQGNGDLAETWDNVSNDANVLNRDTDDRRYAQKYTLGANWYPLRKVRFGAQYYYKIRDDDYTHYRDSTPNLTGLNRYPAFLTARNYAINDVNFRMTWRARRNLTAVGQYDFQSSTIDTRADGLSKVQSADMHSHILSGNLGWVPHARIYTQGYLSYVIDRTDTPATDITPSVLPSRNDYWTANVTLGYVLDDKTDLEGGYFYYRADNYVDNWSYGQPYDAGNEEQGITAGVRRRMSDRILVSLRYGFFTNRDRTSGHHNDFDAHVIYTSMRYLF